MHSVDGDTTCTRPICTIITPSLHSCTLAIRLLRQCLITDSLQERNVVSIYSNGHPKGSSIQKLWIFGTLHSHGEHLQRRLWSIGQWVRFVDSIEAKYSKNSMFQDEIILLERMLQ
jgi:hypothetical protein